VNTRSFADEYSKVLNHHSVIHKDLDFALFKWTNAAEIPMTRMQRLALVPVIAWLGIVEYWFYFALIIVPLLAFAAAFSLVAGSVS
jgi:hypothetical protein